MGLRSPRDALLGRLAVARGFVRPEQVEACLAEQEAAAGGSAGRTQPLGALLLDRGYLTSAQLGELLAAQEEGLAAPVAWGPARAADALFGKRLLGHRLATPEQVNDALRVQARLHDHGIDLRLGEILVTRGVLTEDQVRDTLALQDKTVLRCEGCSKLYNARLWKPGKAVACPACGAALRPPAAGVAGAGGAGVRVSGSAPDLPAVRTGVAPAAAPTAAVAPTVLAPPDVAATGVPTVLGAVAAPAPDRPPERSPRAPEPAGTPFGRYRLLQELGRGGMGVVHKAWDGELKRIVALKLLLAETAAGGEEVERFLREARAAARLRHPGIVQVYDVGSFDGRHFFTMEFIEGEGLDAAVARLPARRCLEVLREVALALQAAHEAGVIHRDVKPANILLDGAGHPHVGDFGLAKEVREGAARRLTVSGAVMGTPHYMSPEQAGGRRAEIGPRSDVWALGVILYEHLAGRVPFDGKGLVEVLRAVAERDPVPPSRVAPRGRRGGRAVHQDLETICLKCLEKDPARRYATGTDLAADLGRYLDGEPIAARPATPSYRMRKWVGRHRGAMAAGGLVAAGLVAAAYAGLHARAQEALAARSILESQLVEKVKAPLAEALWARRAGEVKMLERVARDGEASADELLQRDPALAEAHYLKGLLARLTDRVDEAERELDCAAEARPDDLATRYQRGLVRAARLRALLSEARRAWWEGRRTQVSTDGGIVAASLQSLKEPTIEDLERAVPEVVQMRARAEEDFAVVERLARSGPEAERLGKGQGACGRGLLALCRGNLDVADAALKEALGQDPYLDEARLGLLEVVRGRRLRGQVSDRDLVQAYDQALEVNKGMAEIWSGAAEARSAEADRLFAGGKVDDAFQAWKDADERAQHGVRVAPARAEPLVARAAVIIAWAEAQTKRGQDPRALLEEAIRGSTEALRLSPESVDGCRTRAAAHTAYGMVDDARGRDPRTAYRKALADCDAALKRSPRSAAGYHTRARTYLHLAVAEEFRQVDPQETYARALADCEQAARLEPPSIDVLVTKAKVYERMGMSTTGGPSQEAYRKSIATCDEAIRLRPEAAEPYSQRGWCYVKLSETQEGGEGLIAKAIADYDESLRLNPDQAEGYAGRGATYGAIAVRELSSGRDANEHLRRAFVDYSEALRRNPEYWGAYHNRALACIAIGQALTQLGRDPRDSYRNAVADFTEVIRRNPECATFYSRRADVCLLLGPAEEKHGQDPREVYRQGIADYGEVLRLRPEDGGGYNNRGLLYTLLGEAERTRGVDPRDAYRKSIADFDAAVKRQPKDAAVRKNRAQAQFLLGMTDEAAGGDPRPAFSKAIEDCDEALRLDPGNAENANQRGVTYGRLGQAEAKRGVDARDSFRRAVADFDLAIRGSPDRGGFYKNRAIIQFEVAGAEIRRKGDPREALRKAIADCDEALRRAPQDGDSLCCRASAWRVLGEAEKALGGEPSAAFERAQADYTKALELHHAAAWLGQGLLLRDLGRLDEALASFAAAAQDPTLAAQAQAEIERTRRLKDTPKK